MNHSLRINLTGAFVSDDGGSGLKRTSFFVNIADPEEIPIEEDRQEYATPFFKKNSG